MLYFCSLPYTATPSSTSVFYVHLISCIPTITLYLLSPSLSHTSIPYVRSLDLSLTCILFLISLLFILYSLPYIPNSVSYCYSIPLSPASILYHYYILLNTLSTTSIPYLISLTLSCISYLSPYPYPRSLPLSSALYPLMHLTTVSKHVSLFVSSTSCPFLSPSPISYPYLYSFLIYLTLCPTLYPYCYSIHLPLSAITLHILISLSLSPTLYLQLYPVYHTSDSIPTSGPYLYPLPCIP